MLAGTGAYAVCPSLIANCRRLPSSACSGWNGIGSVRASTSADSVSTSSHSGSACSQSFSPEGSRNSGDLRTARKPRLSSARGSSERTGATSFLPSATPPPGAFCPTGFPATRHSPWRMCRNDALALRRRSQGELVPVSMIRQPCGVLVMSYCSVSPLFAVYSMHPVEMRYPPARGPWPQSLGWMRWLVSGKVPAGISSGHAPETRKRLPAWQSCLFQATRVNASATATACESRRAARSLPPQATSSAHAASSTPDEAATRLCTLSPDAARVAARR